MNKIKENKKLFVIILIISLIAILLGSYAIYKNSNKDETASKIEKSEKLEKKTEKKLKEAKKSGNKEEIAKAEKELKEAEEKTEEVKNKKSTSSPSASSSNANTGKSTPTTSKPSTSSSSGTTSSSKPSPKPKEKKKVWIVDKPAWTETVTKYRNEQVTKYTCGGKIFDDYESGYEYLIWCTDNGIECGNLGPVTVTVQVPYTETINHPEEGHEGYR